MLRNKTVLVLDPHSDDGAFGCGGTIAKLVSGGVARVYALSFLGLNSERIQAASVLQMDMRLLDLPVRHFSAHKQEILEKLVALKKEIKPDLVIQPSLSDIHQDHQVIAQEGLRAFKDTTLWGYELPWNNLNFAAQLFVSLDDSHVETKIEAIKYFESQKHRPYANEKYIQSLMMTRGVQVGVKNAEAFNVIRQVER